MFLLAGLKSGNSRITRRLGRWTVIYNLPLSKAQAKVVVNHQDVWRWDKDFIHYALTNPHDLCFPFSSSFRFRASVDLALYLDLNLVQSLLPFFQTETSWQMSQLFHWISLPFGAFFAFPFWVKEAGGPWFPYHTLIYFLNSLEKCTCIQEEWWYLSVDWWM